MSSPLVNSPVSNLYLFRCKGYIRKDSPVPLYSSLNSDLRNIYYSTVQYTAILNTLTLCLSEVDLSTRYYCKPLLKQLCYTPGLVRLPTCASACCASGEGRHLEARYSPSPS